MVEVVGEADIDAASRRAGQRIDDDRGQRIRQPDVVDGDLERPLRRRDEVGERVCGLFRRLTAVGESPDLYRAAFTQAPSSQPASSGGLWAFVNLDVAAGETAVSGLLDAPSTHRSSLFPNRLPARMFRP